MTLSAFCDGALWTEAQPPYGVWMRKPAKVDYCPAGRTAPHDHVGSVFAFLVVPPSGYKLLHRASEFKLATGIHFIRANVSATSPARTQAGFVAPPKMSPARENQIPELK